MRTAKKVFDFTDVRKAHDEAEKLRVESTPFYAEDAQVVEATIAQRPQKP
jgi:hypothetical protein